MTREYMTIKEFNGFFKNEKNTMLRMINEYDEYLTYNAIFNSEDLLNSKLKQVKDGKVKKQLMYKVIRWRERLERMKEKEFMSI